MTTKVKIKVEQKHIPVVVEVLAAMSLADTLPRDPWSFAGTVTAGSTYSNCSATRRTALPSHRHRRRDPMSEHSEVDAMGFPHDAELVRRACHYICNRKDV